MASVKLSQFPPHVQARINEAAAADRRKKAAARRAELLAQPRVAGELVLWIPGDPPMATHHDKEIQRRGTRMKLVDTPHLKATRDFWALGIQANNNPAKILGPLAIKIEARWYQGDLAELAGWRVRKPDWDNFAKPLVDILTERGWIERDEQVAWGLVEKKDVRERADVGTIVRVETIRRPATLTARPGARCSFTPHEGIGENHGDQHLRPPSRP